MFHNHHLTNLISYAIFTKEQDISFYIITTTYDYYKTAMTTALIVSLKIIDSSVGAICLSCHHRRGVGPLGDRKSGREGTSEGDGAGLQWEG